MGIALAIGAFALAGCGGGAAQNTPAVEPPPPAETPTGAPSQNSAAELATGWRYRFEMTSPQNENFGVTTRELYMYFRPDTNAVFMRVENRLGVAVKILWDEMTFTDAEGRTSKAVHRGATYDNRLQAQEPTWVQAKQTYTDIVFPVHLLEDPSAAAGRGARELLPTDLRAQAYVGKSFGFKLVFLAESEERLEYDVRFRIASTYPVR
jgi:hypothetical protein